MLLTSQWPGLNQAKFLVLLPFLQVRAEQCDNGLFCSPPKTCCYDSCCQVYSPDTNNAYGPSTYPGYGYYRLGFWNVWYFWLVVICIAMSCFGGCGYWRRRQIYLSTSTTTHIQIQNSQQAEAGDSERASVTSGGTDNYTTYSEAGCRIPTNVRHGFPDCLRFPPPPYSEVTSKPEMYPLVQAGFLNLKDLVLPSLYTTTPFISSLLEYESGQFCGPLAGSACSPADSNASSLCRTATPSNSAFPPPYTEGRTYSRWACAPSTVSTPGSVMDMYASSEYEYDGYSPQRCTSLVSPPMATTPTSQSMFSELSSTCSSPQSHSPSSPSYISPSSSTSMSPTTATHEYDSSRHGENLLAAIVADIRDMTQRVNVTSPSTSSTDPSSNTSLETSKPMYSKQVSMSACGDNESDVGLIDEATLLLPAPTSCPSQQ